MAGELPKKTEYILGDKRQTKKMPLLKESEKKSLLCLTVNIPLRILDASSQDKFYSRAKLKSLAQL